MFVKVLSGAVMGVNGYVVTVEADVSNGLPGFDIVGLPDNAVKESRERVRTAIRNAGFAFPIKQITVNLAPADTRKSGPAFDLPVAVGILMCAGALPPEAAESAFYAGELSLDGGLRPVNGILPMALAARAHGITRAFVPAENAAEAALVEGLAVFPLAGIQPLTEHWKGAAIPAHRADVASLFAQAPARFDVDFADVMGQANVKRALEIAAAGYHNVLMVGPPGAGKTMMARRMPTILPDLSLDESMEITKIYSIAGLLNHRDALLTQRPFRAPHHTASYAALTGGGRIPMPGEISLAHNGVLFLDELPEFQKKALETLRQPLEDGNVTIARAGGVNTYPSAFLLMASMNPCPCGYWGTGKCNCTANEVARYLGKISGPLLDRIDLQVEAAAAAYQDLENSGPPEETSQAIKARVARAQERQSARFRGANIRFNAKMSAPQVKKYCPLGRAERALLKQAFDSMDLSARAYHKILKIARTIADLAGVADITTAHLAEAISYRGLDRKYW